MLWAALRLHVSHGRWWLAFGGVVSLVWGVMLAAAPLIGAVVLAWWLGSTPSSSGFRCWPAGCSYAGSGRFDVCAGSRLL